MILMLTCFYIGLGVVYAVILCRDLWHNRTHLNDEPGSPCLMALTTATIQFLATFGISDFNMSIPIYRATRWVEDRKMPGTLMTASVLPAALISVLYISGDAVAFDTLLCCIFGQTFGSAVGGKLFSKRKNEGAKLTLAIVLLASACVVVWRMLWGGGDGGSMNRFPVSTLLWLTPVYFILGVLNTMGFGVKALSIALLLTLGLSADCVLPVALSSCCGSCFSGAVQFIKNDSYCRKVAAVSSVAGLLGVLLGTGLVKSLPMDALQWVMVVVMVYTAVSMLLPGKKKVHA